jgi:hypothetical protein
MMDVVKRAGCSHVRQPAVIGGSQGAFYALSVDGERDVVASLWHGGAEGKMERAEE